MKKNWRFYTLHSASSKIWTSGRAFKPLNSMYSFDYRVSPSKSVPAILVMKTWVKFTARRKQGPKYRVRNESFRYLKKEKAVCPFLSNSSLQLQKAYGPRLWYFILNAQTKIQILDRLYSASTTALGLHNALKYYHSLEVWQNRENYEKNTTFIFTWKKCQIFI